MTRDYYKELQALAGHKTSIEPGTRVNLDTEPLNLTDGPWLCTVIQSTETHALVVPDKPWRDSSGGFIQPWVPVSLLTVVR